MAKTVVWTVVFCLVAAVLQSTLLSRLALYRAVPDLALGIVVYAAYINGAMTGQLSGFFGGILLDFLSAAPLGLNALIRVFIGALTGVIKGTFFLDPVFLPMILCALATLVKAAALFILHLLFSGAVPAYSIGTPVLWAELALNALSAPLLFALLNRFKPLLTQRSKN
jgi:rod shape-determining protein MreD